MSMFSFSMSMITFSMSMFSFSMSMITFQCRFFQFQSSYINSKSIISCLMSMLSFLHFRISSLKSIISVSMISIILFEKNGELKFYYFEDASSLTLGTEDGYKIYSLTSTDKLDLVYSNQEKEVGYLQTRRRR